MPSALIRGVRIEYETFGLSNSPAIVLIAGSGAQLLFWDEIFCEMLVASGLFVVRFDNRDSGLSTKFDNWRMSDAKVGSRSAGDELPVEAPYTLNDMAEDVVGLLDILAIKRAHICGASMGGMIAQVFASCHPERTLSLVSIMSNTGNPSAKPGSSEAIAALTAPAPDERGAYIAYQMDIWRRIWSPGYPFEEERALQFISDCYDRSFCPEGMMRQNLALLASGDRRHLLREIQAPTCVIHGAGDPLIPVESGIETASIIPEAELEIIDGMGHDLPIGVWPKVVAAISKNAARALG